MKDAEKSDKASNDNDFTFENVSFIERKKIAQKAKAVAQEIRQHASSYKLGDSADFVPLSKNETIDMLEEIAELVDKLAVNG